MVKYRVITGDAPVKEDNVLRDSFDEPILVARLQLSYGL